MADHRSSKHAVPKLKVSSAPIFLHLPPKKEFLLLMSRFLKAARKA
jgi:hypothetical protein